MGPPNENPAEAGGGASERNDLADEADRTEPNSDMRDVQVHCPDVSAEAPALAQQQFVRVYLGSGQPSAAELHWLFRQGVRLDAMCSPWRIGAAQVRFDGRTFEFDPTGERCITFVILDRAEPFDIAAWSPKTGKLGTWRGQAFCLGDLDDLSNPAIYFEGGALRVYPAPLEWLKNGRDGIVILRPELSYIYLGRCHRLWVPDMQFAASVTRWLEPPRSKVKIIVGNAERAPT